VPWQARILRGAHERGHERASHIRARIGNRERPTIR
jgi:hypothetical protein